MTPRWEPILERWVDAGLVDTASAERIRAWETARDSAPARNWPVLLAVAFGALLLGAGVLLFVAAHWDELGPGARFGLVLGVIATFHGGGAFGTRSFPALATALHAVGTVTLGAGIALAGQIFHLEEHWPGGVMLWAIGAVAGFAIVRDWPQAALAALLVPAWLTSERIAAIEWSWEHDSSIAQALLLLAFVYMTAQIPGDDVDDHTTLSRRVFAILGTLAIIPTSIYAMAALNDEPRRPLWRGGTDAQLEGPSVTAFLVSLTLPLLVGVVLRRRHAVVHAVAALWIGALNAFDPDEKRQLLGLLLWCVLGAWLVIAWGAKDGRRYVERIGLLGFAAAVIGLLAWADKHEKPWIYPICIAFSVAVAAWGVLRSKKDSINVAVVVFGAVVLAFYSSSVMDKLGRSASLVGLGALFLAGGWVLERGRRRLLAETAPHVESASTGGGGAP
jgi:uncharacterized membrane protein